MKILFVAVFDKRSTNVSQKASFERIGCTVVPFNYREAIDVYGSPTLRDEGIVTECERTEPDLVVFSKCNGVDYRVISKCNNISKTCMWYMDALGNFTQDIIDKVERCTYSCFSNYKVMEAAEQVAPGRCFHVHEGYDPEVDKPIPNQPVRHEVSFIGNMRGDRLPYLNALNFHVYSNAYGLDHAKAVSESKINLNFTDEGSQYRSYTSDRAYKIPAAGGFLLTQPWPRMVEDGFIDGQRVGTFRSIDEAREKIQLYLRNDELRNAIADRAHNFIQIYSRDNWARRIVQHATMET